MYNLLHKIKIKIKSIPFLYQNIISIRKRIRYSIIYCKSGKLYSLEQFIHEIPTTQVLFRKDIKLAYSPPQFDNNVLKSAIFEDKIYTQYAIKSENVLFMGNSNLIISHNKVLYDLPFYDDDHRIDCTDSKIAKIDKAKLLYIKTQKMKISKAIWMGGNYSFNYYHFLYEFAVKFLLLETLDIPTKIPIFLDQICFQVSQFKNIIDILNTKRYPLMSIGENFCYLTNVLFFINAPNFIPPNFLDINDIKAEDVQFDISLLHKLRKTLLPYSSKKVFSEKIFVSRKNASGRRKFNEDEIIGFFSELGFEVVCLETLSIGDQIAMFNQAKYIVGGSGAAFTNILFCNDQCKCILFQKYCLPLSIFSTIAHVAGADLRYITEEATVGKRKYESLHDEFEIDITHLKNQLLSWDFFK